MRKPAIGFLLAGLLIFPLAGQSEGRVEHRVSEVLRTTSDFLASLDQYRLVIDESLEVDEDEDGVLLSYDIVQELLFVRPDRLFASADGDLVKRSFWYDGTTFTMLDRTYNVYNSGPAPDNIAGLLDVLRQDYGFVGPLAELLFRDLDGFVKDNARAASYIGIHSVGGHRSHHIYVSGRQVDWQLWIDAGEQPLPRKLSLTFRQDQGQPRYSALFRTWDLSPEIKPEAFSFVPPEGARKLDLNAPSADRKPPEQELFTSSSRPE